MTPDIPSYNPHSRFLEARSIMTGASSHIYYDIRGVGSRWHLKPIGICPLYMRVNEKKGMVLPELDIFMNMSHLGPEDYDFYIPRLFTNLPRAVELAQLNIWGKSLKEKDNPDELNALVNSTREGSPIAVASYSIIEGKRVEPRNTLVGIYHLPEIRTRSIFSLIQTAYDDGMAHVWGLKY